jgi:hypothetical protein
VIGSASIPLLARYYSFNGHFRSTPQVPSHAASASIEKRSFSTSQHDWEEKEMGDFLDPESWKDLYQAALFETNRQRLPDRIYQAELAMLLREHELERGSLTGGSEHRALQRALRVLRDLLRVTGGTENPRAA